MAVRSERCGWRAQPTEPVSLAVERSRRTAVMRAASETSEDPRAIGDEEDGIEGRVAVVEEEEGRCC